MVSKTVGKGAGRIDAIGDVGALGRLIGRVRVLLCDLFFVLNVIPIPMMGTFVLGLFLTDVPQFTGGAELNSKLRFHGQML